MSHALAQPIRAVPAWFAAVLFLALAFVATACAQPRTNETPAAIAFVGVNVVPMDREAVLENQTVVVRDGRIISLTPRDAAKIPDGARRIEGEGRWLMPGLTEMHGHVPGPDARAYLENVLFLYVANGVTTVRNMAGHPSHLTLRDRIAAGELMGRISTRRAPGSIQASPAHLRRRDKQRGTTRCPATT